MSQIVEIKKNKISNQEKLADVEKELSSLNQTMKKFIPDEKKIFNFKKELKDVNTKLWDVENGKRAAEKKQDFGEKFISLARSVYKLNDKRASLKLSINKTLGSNIKEVKSHE